MQESYIKVFKSIKNFRSRGEDSFYYWAVQIINDRFVDQLRYLRRKKRDMTREVQQKIKSSSSYDTLLQQCEATLHSPSGIVRRDEALGALLVCVAQLPDHYRTVVERLYLKEEPIAQIAADMNRSEDAVRGIGNRAVRRLTECLGRASRFLSTHD